MVIVQPGMAVAIDKSAAPSLPTHCARDAAVVTTCRIAGLVDHDRRSLALKFELEVGVVPSVSGYGVPEQIGIRGGFPGLMVSVRDAACIFNLIPHRLAFFAACLSCGLGRDRPWRASSARNWAPFSSSSNRSTFCSRFAICCCSGVFSAEGRRPGDPGSRVFTQRSRLSCLRSKNQDSSIPRSAHASAMLISPRDWPGSPAAGPWLRVILPDGRLGQRCSMAFGRPAWIDPP